MRLHRPSTVIGAVAIAFALSSCGSSSTSSTTSTVPAGSSTSVKTGTSSGPQNRLATVADKAALTAAFVAYKKVAAGEIAGTQQGSVYYAYLPSTGTYWAYATFLPTSSASQHTLVGMQDGGGMGIFTKKTGGTWTMVAMGSVPFCPSQTQIPAAVSALWGIQDPQACSAQN